MGIKNDGLIGRGHEKGSEKTECGAAAPYPHPAGLLAVYDGGFSHPKFQPAASEVVSLYP